MTSIFSFVFLFLLLAPVASAHYTPNMEKAFVELSDFCSYQEDVTNITAKFKFQGKSLEAMLGVTKEPSDKELVRALYKANPTTSEQLDQYNLEARRRCIASGAINMNRLYKIPAISFDQEDADLVAKMNTNCDIGKALGMTAFAWKASGVPKDDALKRVSKDEAFTYLVSFAYEMDTSDEKSAQNYLELMEAGCRKSSLELMMRGVTEFPPLPHRLLIKD